MSAAARQASSDPVLTSYAAAVHQDVMAGSIANFLAPMVPVPAAAGFFKNWGDKATFRVHETKRAVGGKRQAIGIGAEDAAFNCKPHALETSLDDWEDVEAGEFRDAWVQAKIRTLLQENALSYENDVIAYLDANVTALGGGVGVWTNNSNDPIAEMDAQILALAKAGMMPNRITMGLQAFHTIRRNTLAKAYLPDNTNQNVTLDAIRANLLNPSIEIRLAGLTYDKALPGVDKAAEWVLGNKVFIHYSSPSPSTEDRSAAKTFWPQYGTGMTGVRSYESDNPPATFYALDYGYDIAIPCPTLIKKFDIS